MNFLRRIGVRSQANVTLWLAVFSLGLYTGRIWARPQDSPPNIVFMMADDMGMGDTSAYQNVTGNEDRDQVATPNMERLARMGVRFTDAHTPSSRCSGTRYGLMTGRYPWRNRLKHFVLFGSQGDPMIEADRPTIASILEEQGYATAMVGKWHVGLRYRRTDGKPAEGWQDADLTQPLHTTPADHGFDYARFTSRSHGTSGPDAAAKPKKRKNNGPGHVHGHQVMAATGKGKQLRDKGPHAYVLSKLGSRHSNHAIEFMKQHVSGEESKAKPFFLYYPSNSNHGPHTPDVAIDGKAVKGAARSVSGQLMGTRYDFVYENDVALGRLLDFLESQEDPRNPGHNLLDNTLVVFTSDNGAEIKAKTATGPFRSNKGSAFEGGHRVPFIAAWKRGNVGDGDSQTAGATSSSRIGLIDMFATFCEITGRELPDLAKGEKGGEDSFGKLTALQGADVIAGPSFHNDHQEAAVDRAEVAFRVDNPVVSGRVFEGQWKLFFDAQLVRFGFPQHYALYDLATDPQEVMNRIDEPELGGLVRRLVELAELHRNAGGHRLAEMSAPSPVRIVWAKESAPGRSWLSEPSLTRGRAVQRTQSAQRDVAMQCDVFLTDDAGVSQEVALVEGAEGLGGGENQLVDQGEFVVLSFEQDVIVDWVAIKAGDEGSCGGYYQIGDGAPLAIYCVDADNDSRDQQGVLSDLGVLQAGQTLKLSSQQHFGCENPGAWVLQAIQYRALN